jgi:hypothetical protein
MGIVRKLRGMGKSTIGSCYKKSGEDTADSEDLMCAVVNCRLYISVNCYVTCRCEL